MDPAKIKEAFEILKQAREHVAKGGVGINLRLLLQQLDQTIDAMVTAQVITPINPGREIKQITGTGEGALIVLCEDNTLWVTSEKEWARIKPIPLEEADEPVQK